MSTKQEHCASQNSSTDETWEFAHIWTFTLENSGHKVNRRHNSHCLFLGQVYKTNTKISGQIAGQFDYNECVKFGSFIQNLRGKELLVVTNTVPEIEATHQCNPNSAS